MRVGIDNGQRQERWRIVAAREPKKKAGTTLGAREGVTVNVAFAALLLAPAKASVRPVAVNASLVPVQVVVGAVEVATATAFGSAAQRGAASDAQRFQLTMPCALLVQQSPSDRRLTCPTPDRMATSTALAATREWIVVTLLGEMTIAFCSCSRNYLV